VHFESPIFITTAASGVIYSLIAVVMLFYPPKKINDFYGYRTKASMQSEERWHFAQRFSSIAMLQSAVVMVLIGIFGLFFTFSATIDTILGLGIMGICILAMVIRTEKALKRFP
jgi:uncharacterized membrane protein